MPNPLVSLVVPLAGVSATVLAGKLAGAGWGAVFGEDAPTPRATKLSRKETAKRRKQARKDGMSAREAKEIQDPSDAQPAWKLLLWALVSGVLIQGVRLLARRWAKAGAERLTTRRPRGNRG